MIELNYKDRIRNLDIKASSKVKSNKFFPVFLIDGKEFIFKPLSKSKPFTTPMFAFAEKFWSDFFCELRYMPKYELAICHGYEEAEKKYYDYGTIVANILRKDEQIINLYEYFEENPDSHINISDYTNYCMMFYDYRPFFETDFFKINPEIAKEFAMQLLMSIVSGDENFHYENVQFIKYKNQIELAPMLDHEFSVMFLAPDYPIFCIECNEDYMEDLEHGVQYKNMVYICKHFPDIAKEMLDFLETKNIEYINIDMDSFNFPCSYEAWKIGKARYKDNDEELALKLETQIKLKTVNFLEFNWLYSSLIKNGIAIVKNVLKSNLEL